MPACALSLIAACGLAVAVPAQGQGPLGEAFPPVLRWVDLDGEIGFRILGTDRGAYAGHAVSGAGDINGDGIDDLVIGDFDVPPDAGGERSGEAYVVFGRPDGLPPVVDVDDLDGTNGFRLSGAGAFPFTGYGVSSAGDVNGDGIDDLFVASHAGALVVFGSREPFPERIDATELDGEIGFVIESPGGFDTVASAGDVNGDGVDDVVAGDRFHGRAFVVFGRREPFPALVVADDLDGSDGFRFTATETRSLGRSVAGVGDVNGDGVDDVAIGQPQASPDGRTAAGKSFVVFGRREPFPALVDLDALDGSNGFRMDGEAITDFSGWSVSAAGDINGDGVDDLAVGAPQDIAYIQYDFGHAYVVFGRGDGVFPASFGLGDLDGSDGFRMDGATRNDTAGHSVGAAGDINGDGFDDLLVGGPGRGFDFYIPPYGPYTITPGYGTTYVIFGGDSFEPVVELQDVDGESLFRIDGRSSSTSGYSVAGAGDVNGDGIDDIITGARNRNQAYVIYGRQLGCRVDLDGDGQLTVFDSLEFQNLFDAGDLRADFDGDGSLTLFDFLGFQNAFDAGCE